MTGARVAGGVEHKLWAPEGPGQLEKYLRIAALDRLVFVTAVTRPVAEAVRSHARYASPGGGRAHFQWTDLYALVAHRAMAPDAPFTTRALLRLFDQLGFQPPPPLSDELSSDGASVVPSPHDVTQRMDPLLDQAREALDALGWVNDGAKPGELWRVHRDGVRRVRKVHVNAVHYWPALKIRLHVDSEEDRAAVLAHLMLPAAFPGSDVAIVQPYTSASTKPRRYLAAEVHVGLRAIFGDAVRADERAERLAALIAGVTHRGAEA